MKQVAINDDILLKERKIKLKDLASQKDVEASGITLVLSDRVSFSNGLYQIPFDIVEEVTGSTFEYDDKNHAVRVKEDCCALLSGAMFMDGSTGEGYCWTFIRVNGSNKTSNLERIINRDYTHNSVPAVFVSLKKNDVITMHTEYSSLVGNISVRNGIVTFMSVVKI